MTMYECKLALKTQEVVQELSMERQREHEWLQQAAKGTSIPIKIVKEGETLGD